MRFRRLSQFSVRGILDSIRALQEAVEALQPQKSSGTLIDFSSQGVNIRASKLARTSGGGAAPTTDQPARWQ